MSDQTPITQDMLDLFEEMCDRTVGFKPAFARIAGGAMAGLFLSQAMFLQKITEPKTTLTDDDGSSSPGWWWHTRQQWEAETYMSRYEQETARKALGGLGFLEERMAGLPYQLHYRVNREAVIRAVVALVKKNRKPVQEGSNQPDQQDGGNSACRESHQQDGGIPTIKEVGIPPALESTERCTTDDGANAPHTSSFDQDSLLTSESLKNGDGSKEVAEQENLTSTKENPSDDKEAIQSSKPSEAKTNAKRSAKDKNAPKQEKERPRDNAFDLLARLCFCANSPEDIRALSKTQVGKLVTVLKSMRDASRPVTVDSLAGFFRYWQEAARGTTAWRIRRAQIEREYGDKDDPACKRALRAHNAACPRPEPAYVVNDWCAAQLWLAENPAPTAPATSQSNSQAEALTDEQLRASIKRKERKS